AAITIAVDTNTDVVDNIINAVESTQVTITGTVINVEDGQTVTLTVTDGTTALTFDTSVTAGAWTVSNA
ncbi:hypothetical protein AADZ84_17845, partial [Colwelliaceae bacterium MEBiC 14330]